MAEWSAVSSSDLHLIQRVNTPVAAFELLEAHLTEHHLAPATAQEMQAPRDRDNPFITTSRQSDDDSLSPKDLWTKSVRHTFFALLLQESG